MADIRKIVTTREVVLAEMGVALARPVVRWPRCGSEPIR
jgi:hypothetical protein